MEQTSPSKENGQKLTPSQYNDIIKGLELKDIFLSDCQAKLYRKKNVDIDLSIESKVGYIFNKPHHFQINSTFTVKGKSVEEVFPVRYVLL